MGKLKVIGTQERTAYRDGPDGYYAFLERHFPEDNSIQQAKAAPHPNYLARRVSPFLFVSMGLDDNKIRSHVSMFITTRASMDAFLAGEITENEIEPYPPGSNAEPVLFWMVLILEERSHAPYLIRHVFKQLEAACRAWKLNIQWVYSYAYTKVSERLMRRYQFTKVADHQGHWSIMASKVTDNPYLRVLIPNVANDKSHDPFPSS